jgi:hypothetical protein
VVRVRRTIHITPALVRMDDGESTLLVLLATRPCWAAAPDLYSILIPCFFSAFWTLAMLTPRQVTPSFRDTAAATPAP